MATVVNDTELFTQNLLESRSKYSYHKNPFKNPKLGKLAPSLYSKTVSRREEDISFYSWKKIRKEPLSQKCLSTKIRLPSST